MRRTGNAPAIGLGAFSFAITTLIAGLLLLLAMTVREEELQESETTAARPLRRR
jgi:hypothetical protein